MIKKISALMRFYVICLLICTSFTSKIDSNDKGFNVIFIYPDQFRQFSLGIWNEPEYKNMIRTKGDPVYTPNLNYLAKRGLLFSQATTTHPACSPSRAMLLTGMYSTINGIYGRNCKQNRNVGLRHDIPTFTGILSEYGYETAYIGKAHWEKNEPLFDKNLNYIGKQTAPGGFFASTFDTYIPPGPGRHGNAFWFQNMGGNHFNPNSYSSVPETVNGLLDGHVFQPKRFTPEVEVDIIIDFLENKNNQRDENKPFSVFWSPNPPHPPFNSTNDVEKGIYEQHYKDKSIDQLLLRDNVRINDDPNEIAIKSVPFYFSNVSSIDYQVGRIISTLKSLGQEKNTIIVFTTDHGEMMGSHGKMSKNAIYEESFLAPLIIYHPEVEHRVEDLMIGTVDIMPTLLSMLDLPIPKTVQGIDFSYGLINANFEGSEKPKSSFYTHPTKKGIRTEKFTYLISNPEEVLIFDNEADPYQLTPLSHAEIQESESEFLKTELGNWLNKVGDSWASKRLNREYINYPKNTQNFSVTGLGISSPQYRDLNLGTTDTLSYRITPSNANNKKVTWQSEYDSVASIDNNGVVTAQSSGNTAIIAKSEDGGFEAKYYISVTEPNYPSTNILTYPNPASSNLDLLITNNYRGTLEVRMIGLNGHVLLIKKIEKLHLNLSYKFDVSTIPSGLITMIVLDEKRILGYSKFVKI